VVKGDLKEEDAKGGSMDFGVTEVDVKEVALLRVVVMEID
jgi:hypothetical protein